MTVALVINGITYDYPEEDDVDWGPSATDWATAVTNGMLQKSGGSFTLTNEVDFGASYGLKSLYYKTRTANIASAGQFRLARADVVSWRNQANSADLDLSVNASNELLFNGVQLANFVTVTDTDSIDLTLAAGDLSADLNLSASAAGAGELKLTLSIENDGLLGIIDIADTSTTGALSSTDWNTFNGKQASGNYITALTGNIGASGPGSVVATIQPGVIVDSMINASAGISFSKLAALTSANILVGSAGNVATSVAVTGDVTIGNTGVTAIGANKVTNAMLAQVATATFKGRTTASTGNVEDLTATQATALLNVMVGDSGAGGTKGLVPAPASGDATKFFQGDGTWGVPSGAGDVVGPASAVANGVALFSGTTGKIIKDGGIGTTSQVLVGGTTPAFGTVPVAALPSGPTVSGTWVFPAIQLATTGGTAASLDFYEEYTYAIQNADLVTNSGGGTFSSTSGTLRVTRIGKLVTITLGAFATTTASSVNGIIIQGSGAIPTRFRPAVQQQLGTYNVGVGGTGVFWRFTVETSGALTLSTRDNTGANTAIANAAYTIGFSGNYTL